MFFGLTFEKLIVLGVIAMLVLGPERLPSYAIAAGRLVRKLRDVTASTTERLREEVGPEFDDVDWRRLDPRQYDPRRIIRDALLDDGSVVAPAARVSRDRLSASIPADVGSEDP